MTTFYDVPASLLIPELSNHLATLDELTPPEWTEFTKTGIHRERPPTQEDWWTIRGAAILRKVAMHGPIGVNHLASMFGGAKTGRVAPAKAVLGSRKIIRTLLQQLDDAGLVSEKENLQEKVIGRVITPAGHALLDQLAHSVRPIAEEKYNGLSKY